jgi:hypothetical protein
LREEVARGRKQYEELCNLFLGLNIFWVITSRRVEYTWERFRDLFRTSDILFLPSKEAQDICLECKCTTELAVVFL